MKSLIIALAAATLLAIPARAQEPASQEPAAQEPAASAPAAGDEAGGGKGGKMKQAMEACRSEVEPQNLKGPEKRKAVEDCIVKAHPELAGRLACRDEARAKGLSGDEMRAYVRTCAKDKG